MKRKTSKKLLIELADVFGEIRAGKVESAVFEDKQIYILDNAVAYVRDANGLYPYLRAEKVDTLPKVVVDMGAIRFVCNGADVMAPGITEMDAFEAGALVVIRDMTHGKALAVGKAKKSSAEIEASRKGKVIQNLHYVGDKLWNAV
ncbi:MAG: RNA-binding protein [Candidatus Bathyarchaeota archaeon]|nr:RNA-binding protein [Candidatus Bathyarchaeota archaeon]